MNPSKKYFSYFLQIIVCATIYFLCGKYGLLFPYAKGNISPLWPPAGIAIAIILLKGPQFLPAIFLGGFMTTFSTNVPVVASIAVGIGNMLEALIGNIIFIQRNGSVRLDKLKDIFTLIIIAIIAPLVATIIGTYSLYWTGIVGYNELKAAVELWYFGDALGIIVFTPLIITWFSYSVSKKNTMQFIEAIAAFCALIASSTITFRVYTDIKYSVIITLVWLAIRFGARSVTLASFIVTTILLYFTFRGEGPFTQYTPHLNLIFLQLFVAAISLTALILSAITTEQKNTAKQLEETNSKLEELVEQRTARLNSLNIKLRKEVIQRRKAEARKDEFIGIASHELKSPITSVLTYVQILDRQFQKEGNEKNIHFISQIHSQLNRMITLINDFLDTSKIRAGKLMLSKTIFNGDELLDQLLNNMRLIDNSHRFIKYGEALGNINADKERLSQVITNLLTNAIKYSPAGTDIKVETQRNKRNILISVHDEGKGISKKDMKHIFDRYFRVDNKIDKRNMSFGLGLFIAKEIITRHRGKIWVESKIHKGSSFHIQIPV